MLRNGPIGPLGKHWFWVQFEFAPDWTLCIQIGPWWTFGIRLWLGGPTLDIDLGLLSFRAGHYPEPELTDDEWVPGFTTETTASGTGSTTYAMFEAR